MSDRTSYRHYVFGPHVIRLAYFIRAYPELSPTGMVPFFEEIDRRWPGLSFRDFMGAAALAEMLAMQPRGRA
jgi:hypothetical protein